MKRMTWLLVLLGPSFFVKAQTGITISLPWINHFSYYDYDKQAHANKPGFAGFGGGVFYQRNKNRISLNASVMADLPAPIGPLDYGTSSPRTAIRAALLEALFRRTIFTRIALDAGVNFTTYSFDYISDVTGIPPSYQHHDQTMGLTMGAEYLFSKHFSLAGFYRPALFYLSTKKNMGILSLDARFNINLWKIKR